MLSESLGTASSTAGKTAVFGITGAWGEDAQSSQVTDHTLWKREGKKKSLLVFFHKKYVFLIEKALPSVFKRPVTSE